MITRINKSKSLKNIFDVTVHEDFMLKNVIQTKKNGIKLNVDVNVKKNCIRNPST